MGRKRATIEYLEKLVGWAGGVSKLCESTGIKRSNLSAYLAGTKPIGWGRLYRATVQVFGQPPAFLPVIEHYELAQGIPTLPKDAGIYALFDSARRIIYYGKATSLYAEVRQTLKRSVPGIRSLPRKKKLVFRDVASYVSAYAIARGDPDYRHDVEALGLRLMLNNTFNKNGASFKRKE